MRVLLINPSVFDTRLLWARWTQPVSLLQLAAHFRGTGADIRLVDALETRPGQRLRRELVTRIGLEDATVSQWRFGLSLSALRARLRDLSKSLWIPDQVYLECATTFWWQGAKEAATLAKQIFPTAQVIMLGAYPFHAPDHAARETQADLLLSGPFPENVGLATDLSVYERSPGFAYVLLGTGLRSSENVVEEIAHKTHKRIVRHIAFADHPLLGQLGTVDHFRQVLEGVISRQLQVRLYVLGNMTPSDLVTNPDLPGLMRRAGCSEIHFSDDRSLPTVALDLDEWEDQLFQAAELCHRAGFEAREASLSVGLCVGRPGEDLRERAKLATRLAHAAGSLIVWPYQPAPDECHDVPLELQNGKLFPLRQQNAATYRDYLNFLGFAAVLNAKYRQRTFDFLGDSLIPKLVRRSIATTAWKPAEDIKGRLDVAPPQSLSTLPSNAARLTVAPSRNGKRPAPVVIDTQFPVASGPAGFKRALLINPPVYDAQYWARWSQPAGLLRVATYLRQQGYTLELIDCMETDSKGYVFKRRRLVDGIPYVVQRDDVAKPVYHFGLDWAEVERRARELEPQDEVWITSIMTYWWESTRDAVSLVRRLFPKAEIIVGGIYPTLAPQHAAANLGADVIFTGELAAASELHTDLSLYHGQKPSYAILTTSRGCPWDCHYCGARTLNGGSSKMRVREPEDVLDEIEFKLKTFGIRRFGFYEDNALVLRGHLQRILELIIERGLNVELYAPEGFETRLLSVELLRTMKQAGFEKVYLPFEALRWETNLGWNRRHASTASFERALDAAITAGFRPRTEEINAFILFGLPDDALEYIVDGALYLHHTVGSIVPMLFTPVPGTQIYREHEAFLLGDRPDGSRWDLQHLNGKLLPFLEYNRQRYPGLQASDYLELEALMSVLNKGKVLSRNIDLCDGGRPSEGFRSAAMDVLERVSAGSSVT